MSSRKGQVTVFIILGIVIFVVILFAIIVSSSLSKIKLQTQAGKVVDAYLQSDAVNYYVYTCMDSAVTSAIDDLALQGGVFYTYQNSSYIASNEGVSHIPYNLSFNNSLGGRTLNFNVSYSIQNTSYCSIVAQAMPEYPYDKKFIKDLFGFYNNVSINSACLYEIRNGYAQSGFAGFNNMSRLCYQGSNNTGSIQNIAFSPCFKSIIAEKNRSVEYTLEEQIALRVKNCTDFSLFPDDNITVLGEPSSSIIYNSETLIVKANYNFSVRIKNKAPILVKHSFEYESNLRLVRMHNYVMSLLKADSQDFMFNLQGNYENYNAHEEINPAVFFDSEHMSVKLINFTNCINCNYKFDHLLIVEDNNSRIGNRSLTYITAIKNRRPALDYIHETQEGSFVDIIVSNNQNITLSPQGYDPDDKQVGYNYEGWKENYDEICTINYEDPVQSIIATGITCTKIETPLPPKIWSESFLFKETKRLANYTTNATDLGYHNVTITVTDESGLQDYQVVKILVFDLPTANISKIQIYDDIPEGIASIEDKLILDGSNSVGSFIGGGTISAYIWRINLWNDDSAWEEVFFNRTTDASIIVPTENYLMESNELIKKIKPLNLSNVGEHNVTLVVESVVPMFGEIIESLPTGVEIDVRVCVPHQNNNDPSYPYNLDDPFLANHTCCEATNEGYSLKDETSICYTKELVGEIKNLKEEVQKEEYKKSTELKEYFELSNPISTPILTIDPLSGYPDGGKYNDVYNIEFERNCDNKRGNICAGDMTATLTRITVCSARASTEDETCTGPSAGINANNECMNYASGTTFETKFDRFNKHGQSANGVCNENPKCSTIGTNGYDAGGPMKCNATCSGGACENTRLQDCSCKMGSSPNGCGAQCDSSHRFERTDYGLNCKSNCDLNNDCVFDLIENLPCATTSCLSTQVGYKDYCYTNVGCNENGKTYEKKEYCKVGVDPDNQNICRYWTGTMPTSCNAGGVCPLHKDYTKPNNCNNFAICDVNNGWVCP
ncbi:MAG: hypothetical protein WC758_03135 [Candidatus Woesearchaeota archaeon]|jgi:hypothetical protein